MTELLMTTWDGGGTTPPLMSVARALVARGHRLRVLADPVLRADVEATGAEFVSWTRAPHRRERNGGDHFVRDWGGDPAEGFARMRDALALGPAAAYAADVREELERRPAAALLTELLLFGPQIAAEAAGIPYVVLNPTVNVVPAPGVPPFGLGLMPQTDEAGRRRDEELGAMMLAAWDEGLPAINAARAEQGLEPLDHVLDQGRAAARVLVMTSGAFDFLGPLPPTVVHVGPRLDDASWAGDWEAPPGEEPLVLVGLSSDYQDQADLLRRIAAALANLPLRAVLTTGNGIDPASIEAPANVQVVKAAPHSAVLREAALAITHGGHGVTIKSLAAGVPLVCLPIGRDQLDIAARVVHAGAGVRLEHTAAAAEIAAAVEQVLGEASYREAAQRIATSITEETVTDRAVEEIEAVLASTHSRDAVTA
jgi:UDP:flavonoid glycosyltransferase YjiC (YdhE family)